MCNYCSKEHNNKPLVQRGTRKVTIEKANEYVYGMFMRWKTEGGHWHMEWGVVNFCPMCGKGLGKKVL